jgi:hypothetical protein
MSHGAFSPFGKDLARAALEVEETSRMREATRELDPNRCCCDLHTVGLQPRRHESTYFLRLPILLFYDWTLLVIPVLREAALLLDVLVSGLVVLSLDFAVEKHGIKLVRSVGLCNRRRMLDDSVCQSTPCGTGWHRWCYGHRGCRQDM